MTIDSHREIKSSFNKAARSYDAHAFTQNVIGQRLMDRLKLVTTTHFHNILDAGCGTGNFTKILRSQYPKSQVVAIDLAYNMVKKTSQNRVSWRHRKPHVVNGDIARLPFQNNSFDLIFCNLALHWTKMEDTFTEFKRILKSEGMLMFTMPGPDTLCELTQVYKTIDAFSHINTFYDMHDVGDELQKLQFQNAVVDMEKITFEYSSVYSILKDLKMTGVRNIHPNRKNNMSSKSRLDQLIKTYPQNATQKYPLTFEVVYGHAICPHKPALTLTDRIPLRVNKFSPLP
jgi:malonyl-CoA O-methyltransferase